MCQDPGGEIIGAGEPAITPWAIEIVPFPGNIDQTMFGQDGRQLLRCRIEVALGEFRDGNPTLGQMPLVVDTFHLTRDERPEVTAELQQSTQILAHPVDTLHGE
ncbi:Uncharacterised protein [Mycobacteroides abscessus subsp. abscessus]|nr:Uncharacterised protein [Mycobacteroides abscessus subsp. abscessus]